MKIDQKKHPCTHRSAWITASKKRGAPSNFLTSHQMWLGQRLTGYPMDNINHKWVCRFFLICLTSVGIAFQSPWASSTPIKLAWWLTFFPEGNVIVNWERSRNQVMNVAAHSNVNKTLNIFPPVQEPEPFIMRRIRWLFTIALIKSLQLNRSIVYNINSN